MAQIIAISIGASIGSCLGIFIVLCLVGLGLEAEDESFIEKRKRLDEENYLELQKTLRRQNAKNYS